MFAVFWPPCHQADKRWPDRCEADRNTGKQCGNWPIRFFDLRTSKLALIVSSGGMMRPTVHDIAAAAGVSLATVDRVLNQRPGVRHVTREKVETAIRELGYVRDVAAANLAKGRTYPLVFILPASDNSFMYGLNAEIRQAALRSPAERTDIRTIEVLRPSIRPPSSPCSKGFPRKNLVASHWSRPMRLRCAPPSTGWCASAFPSLPWFPISRARCAITMLKRRQYRGKPYSRPTARSISWAAKGRDRCARLLHARARSSRAAGGL